MTDKDVLYALHDLGQPSFRQLAKRAGLRSTSAIKLHLLALEREGLITLSRGGVKNQIITRSIRLTDKGREALGLDGARATAREFLEKYGREYADRTLGEIANG